MVTHDPRYAAYAERTVHLFDGKIVEDQKHAPAPSGSAQHQAAIN